MFSLVNLIDFEVSTCYFYFLFVYKGNLMTEKKKIIHC